MANDPKLRLVAGTSVSPIEKARRDAVAKAELMAGVAAMRSIEAYAREGAFRLDRAVTMEPALRKNAIIEARELAQRAYVDLMMIMAEIMPEANG